LRIVQVAGSDAETEWEETPEEEYLRTNCRSTKDLKKIIAAIRARWPTLKYPHKPKPDGGGSIKDARLYNMFDVFLDTLSGGKGDEFLVGFLNGRML
jgi:hypothetical protein